MLPEILLQANKAWTLFLDRDGVVNLEKDNDYIRMPSEFFFLDHVPEAIAIFAGLFGEIFVVTNQKGVGKGLMTEDDLQDIHQYMLQGVEHAGGRISKVYYCTATENDHPNRKPQPGMALQAKADYPQISFSKSIMVGNTLSDMAFGRAEGMYTVFIQSSKPMPELPHPAIDAVFPSLYLLAKALQKPA